MIVVKRVEVRVEQGVVVADVFHECLCSPVSDGEVTFALAGVPTTRSTEVIELPVTVLNPTWGTVTVCDAHVMVVQGVPAGLGAVTVVWASWGPGGGTMSMIVGFLGT